QNNILSVPPPPALVGLYPAPVGACAKPARARSWLANGAERPRPTIRCRRARRDNRPALTAAIRFRNSRSFMGTPTRRRGLWVPSQSRGTPATRASICYHRRDAEPLAICEPGNAFHRGEIADDEVG